MQVNRTSSDLMKFQHSVLLHSHRLRSELGWVGGQLKYSEVVMYNKLTEPQTLWSVIHQG